MKSRSKLVYQVGVAQTLEVSLERYIGPWTEQPDLISYDSVESVLKTHAANSDNHVEPEWSDLTTILSLMEKRREILGKPSLWPMLLSRDYSHPLDDVYWKLKSIPQDQRAATHMSLTKRLLGVETLPETLAMIFP